VKTAWQVDGGREEVGGGGLGGRKKPGGKWSSLVGLCSCGTSPFLRSPFGVFSFWIFSFETFPFSISVLRQFPFATFPDKRTPAGVDDEDAAEVLIGAGQCGERKRREWPASDVIGILTLELGKSVEKTFGVHAPAARTRREHGISISLGGSLLKMRVRMLERAPDWSRDTETAWAGWCSCTPRARQMAMRN